MKSEYKKIDETGSPAVYTPGTGESFPFDVLNAHLWVTAETQTWYNNVEKESDSYLYTKAIVHRQGMGTGKGLLGYETVSVTDKRNRMAKFTFDPKKYGVLTKIEKPDTKIENTFYVETDTGNKLAIVRPTQQKTTDLLKNNVITTNYLSYDAYNQPLSIETEYGSGSGTKTKQEYQYSNTNTGSGSTTVYVLGLTTEEKTTNTRGGSSWIDKTVTTYTNFRPATKTIFTGAAGTLQTGYETFGYDTEGNLTNHTFKPYTSTNTLTASYTYDSNKRWIVTATDPMGLATSYGYDVLGRKTTVSDYLNQTTTFEYDALDRQTKITAPSGIGLIVQKAFAWNSANNGSIISITSTATQQPATVAYMDAFGRTTRESEMGFNGAYIHTDYDYDQYGRLDKKTDPYTATKLYASYLYDAYDRLTQETLPSSRTITIAYSGNTVTTVDAGMSTSKTFDAAGTLMQTADPAGTITYTYRPDGQPSKVKTPDNVETTFAYDTYGRQTSIVDPSAGTIQYQYNNEGLLYKQINARNQTIEYQYTNWGQPLKIISPEQTVDYTYHTTYKDRLNKITAGAH